MEENKPPTYEERLALQAEAIKKLAEEYKASPSDNMQLRFYRELDTFLYLSNAVNGDPKQRSQKAYDFARQIALNKAVQQIPE